MSSYFKPYRKKQDSGGFLYQVHVADGFVDDCDELIQKCTKIDLLTFRAFTEIWKDMNFGSIYQGRTMGAEVIELSEEVVHIAKRFMIKDTGNFEEQVAGLFLVYGLVNLQPYSGMSVLRIVPDDVAAIKRIEMIARRDRRLDVLYVLGSILIKGPVEYHAAEREYGMELSLRKYQEGLRGIDVQGVRPRGVFYRQNEELDMLRELNNLSKLYSGVKSIINEVKPDRSLSYAKDDFFEEAHIKLKQIIDGDLGGDNPEQCFGESEYEKRSNTVSEIKKRAMTNAVENVKFLTGVNESKNTDKNRVPWVNTHCAHPGRGRKDSQTSAVSPSSSKQNASQSSPNIRSLNRSPKGSSQTSPRRSRRVSPKKFTKIPIMNRKGRKKKYSGSSDSDFDSESDDELDAAVTSDSEDENKQGENSTDRVEIDVSGLQADVTQRAEFIQGLGNVEVLGSMPIVITSNATQEFEVEIIDQLPVDFESKPKKAQKSKKKAQKSKKKETKPKETVKKRGRPGRPKKILKTDDNVTESDKSETNVLQEKNDSDVFKKPNSNRVLRTPSKKTCEIKKKIVTGFRKMGLGAALDKGDAN